MLKNGIAILGLTAAFGLMLFGCHSQPAGPSPEQNVGSDDHSSVDPQVEASLAKLTPELHDLAHRQQTCPISGEPLGSMGVPEAVEVQGKTVLICCAHCEDTLKQNPDKYLAKLPQGQEGGDDE